MVAERALGLVLAHALAPALALALGCAAAPSPFPVVGPLPDDLVVATLRERTDAVRSLYATVDIAYDGPELSGTFDAVCQYQAPGRMRITAFKDLLISLESVFDLVLTPSEYAIEVRGESGGENGGAPRLERGPASAFLERHPRFAPFFLAGEAIFLPGLLPRDAGARVIAAGRGPDGLTRVETGLSGGATVTWHVDPRTLEVRRGVIAAAEGTGFREVVLEYAEYRAAAAGAAFIPGRVAVDDAAGPTRVEVRLDELEVNPPLDAAIFRPGPGEGTRDPPPPAPPPSQPSPPPPPR